jgi:hypothetical protein
MRFLILLIILSSCSSANKLRRAEKLISKAEELGAKWRVDSVQVEVPVIVPEIRVDSIFVAKPGDSVVIFKDRLKVILKRMAKDTIMIQAECLADTIRVKVTKTVTKTIQAKSGYTLWEMIILGIAALAVGYVAGRFIKL